MIKVPNSPRLISVAEARRPEAAVVVLHGGASRQGNPMVSPTQLSVLRMIPIARRVARRDRRRLAVFRLLNSTRGWDVSHTPVDDALWALDQVHERLGELPLGLVGHSLGGRAGLLTAEQRQVRSVVALNPWIHPQDGPMKLTGAHVAVVHGTDDRVASPQHSADLMRQMTEASSAAYVSVKGAKHAMLRRGGVFGALAADFTAAVLLDAAPRSASRAVAGETFEV